MFFKLIIFSKRKFALWIIHPISKASLQKIYERVYFYNDKMKGLAFKKSYKSFALNNLSIELCSRHLKSIINVFSKSWKITLKLSCCLLITARQRVKEGILMHRSSLSTVSWVYLDQPVSIIPLILSLKMHLLKNSIQLKWFSIRSSWSI